MSKLLPLRIRLPYSTEEEFIDKYGSNVARGGVFVATRALKPEGTGLAFEFVLADGSRLLRGEGVVVKAQVDAGVGRSGMTVRFVKLDAASKALVDRVVARRAAPEPQQTVPGLVRKTQAPKPVAPRAPEPPEPPAQVPAESQDDRFAAEAESPAGATETEQRGHFAAESSASSEASSFAPESDDSAQGGLFPSDSDDTTGTPPSGHFAPSSDEGETPRTAPSQHSAVDARHVEDTGPGLSAEAEPPAAHPDDGALSDEAALNASAAVADESSGFGNALEPTSPARAESAEATASAPPADSALAADEERELDFDITASLFDSDEDEPSSGSAPSTGTVSTEQSSQATAESFPDTGVARSTRDLLPSSESSASAVSAPESGADTATDAFVQEHDALTRDATSDATTEEQASTFESSSTDAGAAVSSLEAETSATVTTEASPHLSGEGSSDTTEDTSSEVPWFGTPETPAWEANPAEVATPTLRDASTGLTPGAEDEASSFSPRGIDEERAEPANTSEAPIRADEPSSRVESISTTGVHASSSPIESTSDTDPWGIKTSSIGTETTATEAASTQSLAASGESTFATDTDPLARIESTTTNASSVDTAHIEANAGTDVESTAAALPRTENAASAAAQETSAPTEPLANTGLLASTDTASPARTEPSDAPSANETPGSNTDTDATATGTATSGPITAQVSTEPTAPGSSETRSDASEPTSATATGAPTALAEQSPTEPTALSDTEVRATSSESTAATATGAPTAPAEQSPTEPTALSDTEARTNSSESTAATATGAPTALAEQSPAEPTALSATEARATSSESTAATEAPASVTQPATPAEQAPTTLAFQASNTGSAEATAQAPGATTPSPARTEPTPTTSPRPITEARTEPTEAPAPQDVDTARNRRRALLDVPVSAPSTSPAIPEVVLGIDLGTSHARVAVFHEGVARLVPLPGTDGNELPALVAVDGSDELLVGPSAQIEAMRAPRRAAPGLMRLLGLRARSPRLRALAPQLPFPVAADPSGDACVELGGRLVAPTLFTALLLRELKHAATTFVGRKATRAVICAPTHFTDRQRAALRDAATLAGLDAQRILTAPAAAALAHGHGRGMARKRVLVVDLGGGGLGVCVVQVTGDDLEVITTGGDPMVGGLDFDARIAEALASDLATQGIPRPEHPLDWGLLRTAAETAKVALSEREQVEVPLSSGTVPPLTRERMEALTADLAQRVTSVVREVLDSNALSPQGLDAVLLVGGQGRMPLVRRRLEESLGVPVRDDVDARGAVALGAALLGHGILLAEGGKPAASVSEVLSAPIGVAERGGTLRRVLERTTRLPAGKTLVIPVASGPVELALFQGPSPLAAENEYLGRLSLNVERAGEVELHFALTADAALSLEATLPGVRRQPVSLSLEDLDDAGREALVARSPLIGEPEARPGGLLKGLKKLFGRR
ncbi:TIGR02266 family protein [Corallococcus terminator]